MAEEIKVEAAAALFEAPKKKRGWPAGKPRKPRVQEAREDIRAKPIRATYAEIDMNDDDENDRLKIAKELIPDGMDYQWVTASTFGAPMPQRRSRFERKGWTPVPADRHDGLFMPRGFKGEIEVDGLVLYERPLELTIRARNNDRRKAFEQVAIKEQQLMGGDIGVSLDSQHPSARSANRVGKSYERMNIPED